MTAARVHERARRLALAAALSGGCAEPCEEDARAQVLARRATLTIGGAQVEAEVALSAVERERGWMHRRCGMEALALLPEARSPLPIWTCAMTIPVDLFFVADGRVIAAEYGAAACAEPCGQACARYGAEIAVDAVIEAPAGAIGAALGDAIEGLDLDDSSVMSIRSWR